VDPYYCRRFRGRRVPKLVIIRTGSASLVPGLAVSGAFVITTKLSEMTVADGSCLCLIKIKAGSSSPTDHCFTSSLPTGRRFVSCFHVGRPIAGIAALTLVRIVFVAIEGIATVQYGRSHRSRSSKRRAAPASSTPGRSPIKETEMVSLTKFMMLNCAVSMGYLISPNHAGAQPRAVPTVVTVCAPCHGLDGIGRDVEVPNIAGQQSIYLRSQLMAFRKGQRQHPEMRHLARDLTDREIDELVVYYSTLAPQ